MWVRFDDSLGDDPRIATAGPIMAAGVLLTALCYGNRNLTDGWVPAAHLRRLLQDGSAAVAAELAIERLLGAGVLSSADREGIPGFQVHHDFACLQPTREQILKQRNVKSRQKAEAGRLGGLAKSKARRKHTASTNVAAAQQPHSASVAPVPDPDPLKDKSTGAAAPASPPKAPRVLDIATHGHICKAYDAVLRREPNASEADRKEALRKELVDRGMKADPSDPQALRKAMDAVEAAHRFTGGVGSRGGGFTQIADRVSA